MRFKGGTLEEVSTNLIDSNTICTLNNGKSTCLPPDLIKTIYIENEKINNNKSINEIKIPKLQNLIINKVSDDCGCNKAKTIQEKELCIIKNIDSRIINKDDKDCIIYDSFKPEGSHDGKSWLNNTHVDIIQEQLFKKFPNYEYGFIHMIDNIMITPQNLKCIKHNVRSITDIDFVNEVQNNALKWYGVVYNTDPSHKSGQHWFAILFNFNNEGTEANPNYIEYFNSSGMNIQNTEFQEFLENLALKISFKANKKTIFKKITTIQHQKDSTGNCGIYALYYIWSRLSGIPTETFNNPEKKITDKTMEEFRKIMFRKEE